MWILPLRNRSSMRYSRRLNAPRCQRVRPGRQPSERSIRGRSDCPCRRVISALRRFGIARASCHDGQEHWQCGIRPHNGVCCAGNCLLFRGSVMDSLLHKQCREATGLPTVGCDAGNAVGMYAVQRCQAYLVDLRPRPNMPVTAPCIIV
jgi:hypothetical protein